MDDNLIESNQRYEKVQLGVISPRAPNETELELSSVDHTTREHSELADVHLAVEEHEAKAASSPPSGLCGKLSQRFHLWGFGPILFGSRINYLLISGIFGIISDIAGWSEGVTFFFSFLVLIPLAASLGDITEQLALHTNQAIGGLLNATFGNATELIISIFALKNGLLRIIQVTLLGSILSNQLLVLGTAFLLGGYKHYTQKFNKDIAITSSGLLMLAVMGLLFPAVLHAADADSPNAELNLSRFTAILLFLVYGFYVFFQMSTHRDMFNSPDEEEEEEEPFMTRNQALVWLTVVTLFISLFSEFLVRAIDGASSQLGIPQIFIGSILLPIVGNAAEHATAITAAYKNKVDLCLGVAIGSSTQIALFGVPFMVLVAWMFGQPLTMYFRMYETAVVFSSTLIVSFLTSDGTSNWLNGLMLVVAYILVAAGFFAHKDDPADGSTP